MATARKRECPTNTRVERYVEFAGQRESQCRDARRCARGREERLAGKLALAIVMRIGGSVARRVRALCVAGSVGRVRDRLCGLGSLGAGESAKRRLQPTQGRQDRYQPKRSSISSHCVSLRLPPAGLPPPMVLSDPTYPTIGSRGRSIEPLPGDTEDRVRAASRKAAP
jgi:hypothetical protein